jgi:Fe-S-cluster containining protein
MTHAERMELERAAPEAALLWSDHADSRFIRLLTPGGCPLLHMDGDLATCTVHAARPYQCRRFGCFRKDVTAEPYEEGGPLGCFNLSDRIAESLDAHEAYRAMQKRAQPWALAHGWPKDMDQP